MAFSLGNILKSAANTVAKVMSPAYNTLSNLYQAGKSAVTAVGNALKPSTGASPVDSLFSVSGNPANGVVPNSAQPGLNTSSTPIQAPMQSSSVQLKSSTPTALTPMAGSTSAPVVPTTIPSTSLNAGTQPLTTVPAPNVSTPPVTPFSSTPQAPAPGTTTPGATAPNPTALPTDLMNPTSDAAILATQKGITDVNTQLQGKGAALAAAQVQAKVPEYQQQLNDVMSQITTLNNDAVASQLAIEGKPIASEFQSRQIGAVERMRVVKVLGLSAVASALQGNLALAQDYAQKSVDAKFAPLEAELDTLKQQLDFNKDNFTRAESARAEKLTIALNDRTQALADARKNQEDINSIALEAAKNGADANTLNTILSSTNLSDALGTARGALAKVNGIGIYNLTEAQANIASKLADDFEKASGSFSAVRDAYGKIQAAQQGTGISDTALIFAYMKLLDPTSVVREGEQASVQNAGNIPTAIINTYNKLISPSGGKLGDLRDQILQTSGSLYQKAQQTQEQVTNQFNSRAAAYGIPSDLVTRDISAGTQIGGGATAMIGNVPQDQVYARIKALSPNATEDQIQQALAKFKSDPSQLNLLGFSSDLGTSVNGPTNASSIASAIKQVESGGNYSAQGASGESGAYQFMPATWKSWAGKYLGNPNAPLTQANQDTVALARITDLLNQGYNAQQIALIWNGGQPIAKKGVNSKGVAYDSGAYAQKVLNALSSYA